MILDLIKSQMHFECLLVFSDPPREDAIVAIRFLQDLGVNIKILTGDNYRVAMKICQDLGIAVPDVEAGIAVMTVPTLEALMLSGEDFQPALHSTTIFAKLTPKQKMQILHYLRKKGGHASVGMLRDGANGCGAFQSADVGISVANAPNITKDAAHIVSTNANSNSAVSVIPACFKAAPSHGEGAGRLGETTPPPFFFARHHVQRPHCNFTHSA